jgi:hypothetical protein
MRSLVLLVALSTTLPLCALRQEKTFAAPPPGQTLPISLQTALQSGKLAPGQVIRAELMQRVPVSSGGYLPRRVEVLGKVVRCDASSVSILFDQLRWKGQTIPVHLELRAAASLNNVFQTTMPVGGIDRSISSPADWTTRQVGGDEVYRSAGSGKVYNQYSEPVGFADLHGVYQDARTAGELPRAMGPFSTSAEGLHGLTGFKILSPGGAGTPVTLGAGTQSWKIASGAAMLMEVVR